MFEYFSQKTVLLTGCAGFIGSHLTAQLLSLGAEVIGVDNFLSGHKRNLATVADNPHFTFIEADVNQPPETYLPARKIDLILHFASPASPPRYQAHPVETYLVNSYATHLLLQYLKANNAEGRFLFASTSEIYGDPLEHPQRESYRGNVNPNGPRACYDEGKRLGETICGVHQRDFGMDVRLIRIFNTYGPHMDPDDGRVIPAFASELLKDEVVVVFGDGTQTRSYCFIDDLVDGILRVASFENLAGCTINLGNSSEFTVKETAEVMAKVMGKPLQIEYKPLPKDDPLRRKPDISQAQKVLGWEPKVSLEDGLVPTLEYFKKLVSAS